MPQEKSGKHTTTTYKLGLRHGGNILHETPLAGITEREIMLLRRLHGEEAIVNPVAHGELSFATEKDELYYLARKYANTSDPTSGRKLVEAQFNVPLLKFEEWLDEQRQLEEMERTERAEAHEAELRRIDEEREQKRMLNLANVLRSAQPA